MSFPEWTDSHFKVSDRWMTATWIMGNNYRGSGYYGAYPPGYIKRIYSMFPDAESILHLFSGSLSKGDVQHPGAAVYRLDLNDAYQPDIVADAEATGLDDARYDLIMADPPYSKEDAEHYGRSLCNKRKVLAECHRLLKPDGTLLWMDQSQPMYRRTEWHWYGLVSIYRSTNHRIRGVFFYEKRLQ
jgi:hypothetical protein